MAAAKDPHDDPFSCRPLSRDHVTDAQAAEPDAAPAEPLAPPPHVRIAWSELLRRTFDDPLVCPRCHGPMRLIAVSENSRLLTCDPRFLDLATPRGGAGWTESGVVVLNQDGTASKTSNYSLNGDCCTGHCNDNLERR